MKDTDILVVSETSRDAKAAFVKFKDTFFDRPWVKKMFTHPHPMFILADGSEITFIDKTKLAKYKPLWKGQIYPDSLIHQVVRSKWGV